MARRIADKPKLIFAAQVRRKPFFRRFMWSLLAIVAAFGALVVLDYVTGLELADATLLLIGKIVALVVMALFAIRGLANLWRAITYKSESMQFFDKGLVWRRDDKVYRYGWSKLAGFREGARTLRLFGRPFLQIGAQTLRMNDKREFNFLGRHGDSRRFANAIRPYVAEVTGSRMGRALRAETPVRLHKNLVLHPGGIEVGKQVILWSELDVQRSPRQLTIRKKNEDGKFKTVRRFDVHQIENIDGFMDLAVATIRNHQRPKTAQGSTSAVFVSDSQAATAAQRSRRAAASDERRAQKGERGARASTGQRRQRRSNTGGAAGRASRASG